MAAARQTGNELEAELTEWSRKCEYLIIEKFLPTMKWRLQIQETEMTKDPKERIKQYAVS